MTSLFYAEREWGGGGASYKRQWLNIGISCSSCSGPVKGGMYRWTTLPSFKSLGNYVVIRVVLPSKKNTQFLQMFGEIFISETLI